MSAKCHFPSAMQMGIDRCAIFRRPARSPIARARIRRRRERSPERRRISLASPSLSQERWVWPVAATRETRRTTVLRHAPRSRFCFCARAGGELPVRLGPHVVVLEEAIGCAASHSARRRARKACSLFAFVSREAARKPCAACSKPPSRKWNCARMAWKR